MLTRDDIRREDVDRRIEREFESIERTLAQSPPENRAKAFAIRAREVADWIAKGFVAKNVAVDIMRDIGLSHEITEEQIQEGLATSIADPFDAATFQRELDERLARRLERGSSYGPDVLAPSPALGPLRKRLDVFLAEYEPLAYVFDPIIRNGSLYTLTGKTNAGKTGVLLAIAIAKATGRRDALNCDVEQGRVVYITVENPDDIRMRFMVVADRLGIDVDEIVENIEIIDRKAKPEEILADLAEVGPLSLAIVDTFAALFDGDNVNDAVQAGNFMRRLRPLTRLPGLPAVVCATHPVKNAGPDQLIPYGSGAILNEVDGNLTLWREDGIASLHWQGKLRGLEFEPLLFKSELWGCNDVLDTKGRQVMLPVFLPTTAEVADARESGVGTRNIAILRALRANPRASQRELATATGVSKGSIGRALWALVRGRFIDRGADEKYHLTPKGEKEVDELA